MLALKGVTVTRGKTAILSRASMEVRPGEFVAVVGASGSGKTTIVRLFLRAIDPTQGGVIVDNIDVKKLPAGVLPLLRKQFGVVFQGAELFPEWTIAENVSYPLTIAGIGAAAAAKRTAELLKHMTLSGVANKLPADVSPSQRALAAVARAVIHKPAVIIADEPTELLDHDGAKLTMALLEEAHKRDATVILLTKDASIVPRSARVLELRDGALTEKGRKHVEHKTSHAHTFELPRLEHAPAHVAAPVAEPSGKRKVRITAIGSDL